MKWNLNLTITENLEQSQNNAPHVHTCIRMIWTKVNSWWEKKYFFEN